MPLSNRVLSMLAAVMVATSAAAPAQEAEPAGAYAIEAAGATLGSAAGLAAGLALSRPDRCGQDDVACIVQGLGAAALVSAAAAPLGVHVAGKVGETRPSLVGAAAGSVAGVAAAAGILKLLEEADAWGAEGIPAAVVYSVTHGVLTALGSRIGASLRR